MAKAKFHKSQRVFVKPVGTWAYIERVVPKWIRGCDEPIKISYDCGMGREFVEDELEEETSAVQNDLSGRLGEWRLVRAQNRWKSAEQCQHHPFPGTHPLVVTGEQDWGGWRVPGAEYDLDPQRIEKQAQLIVRAPSLVKLMRLLVSQADQHPENMSEDMSDLVDMARTVLKELPE
ncbi:MAG: hypothetical protein ACPW61_08830 [Methyloligella sp. ZOD6]